MDRKELETHFNQAIMMRIDTNKLLWALLMDDKIALGEMRDMCAAQQVINQSYLDAFDADVDDHERNAIVACVRHSEPIRHEEVAAKAADMRSGKIKV